MEEVSAESSYSTILYFTYTLVYKLSLRCPGANKSSLKPSLLVLIWTKIFKTFPTNVQSASRDEYLFSSIWILLWFQCPCCLLYCWKGNKDYVCQILLKILWEIKHRVERFYIKILGYTLFFLGKKKEIWKERLCLSPCKAN